VVVTVVGFTVLGAGLVMIVTPGPAFLVIPAGLAILATRFTWARYIMDKLRDRFERARKRHRSSSSSG
jgi:tellurite resistance protein TerC